MITLAILLLLGLALIVFTIISVVVVGSVNNCLDYQMHSQEITTSGAGNGSCSFAEITLSIMTK